MSSPLHQPGATISQTPPRTPTKTTGPAVRVTLPTPPSFSARKAAQRAQAESSPESDSNARGQNCVDEDSHNTRTSEGKKKGHNRSVSFNLPDLSPISPAKDTPTGDSPTTATGPGRNTPNSAPLASGVPGVYKIPQRTLASVSGGIIAPGPVTANPSARRGPPRPLVLGPSLASAPAPRVKTAAAILGGKSTGFNTPSGTPSRWSSTAASRGLSLNPSALNRRHSTSMARSIWSAALPSLGEASGWISPALASARSVMGANRTRGLTVAVLKEEGAKELLIETLPTPGLPKLGGGADDELGGNAGKESPAAPAEGPGTPNTASSTKPREIILCRYYHTPGLTCTSRPCRFVHSLDKLNLLSSEGEYDMRSPRTATGVPAMHSAKSDMSDSKNPNAGSDPTSGTFAAHQIQAKMKTLTIKDVDEKGIEPGERVTVSSPGDMEVPGVVFLMSGGGKGAVGKSKIKFKTEQCRDFAAGQCPYGDYCSFLHGEISRTPEPTKPGTLPSPADIPTGESDKDTRAARRKSFDPAAIRKPVANAWKSGPPSALRPTPLKLDQSNITDANAAQSKDKSKIAPTPLSAKDSLSAFAVPFLENPVEVDKTGEIVPASARLPISALKSFTGGASGTFAAAQKSAKENTNPLSPALPGRASLAGAWRKGAPKTLSTVRIIEPPVSIRSATSSDGDGNSSGNEPTTPLGAQTLVIPNRGMPWSGLGSATDSDPATPWDPALRAARNRTVESDGTGDDHESIVTQQSAMYGYGTYTPDGSWSSIPSSDGQYPAQQYGADMQYGIPPVGYPYGAPMYPWGMPMSPVDTNAGAGRNAQDQAQYQGQGQGGLGVMWTPNGWAVQDAAMKMALFSAESRAAGGEHGGKARNYWRTRKCRFFAEGNCPHGDSCTFIHSTSSSPPKSTKVHPKQKTQPCKFFNSATGCLNAESCTFLHTMVVPESAQLVEKPRPWRTRPCRHFQVGRCHLGDVCHFAHVYEAPQSGMDGGGYLTEERLERAMREMKTLGGVEVGEDSDDDDLEIVTTGDASISFSMSRSHSGSTIV